MNYYDEVDHDTFFSYIKTFESDLVQVETSTGMDYVGKYSKDVIAYRVIDSNNIEHYHLISGRYGEDFI